MKHIKWWQLLIGLLLLSALPAACSGLTGGDEDSEGTPIYYIASTESARGSDAIRPSFESLELPDPASPEEEAFAIVQRLLEGPTSDSTLRTPLPGVRLQKLYIHDHCVHVDLSREMTRFSGVELTMAEYCITLSLTEMEQVFAVSITADGTPVGPKHREILHEKDVRLLTREDAYKLVTVSLYFPNEEGRLIEERRTLRLYEGHTVVERTMEALAEGPESRELHTVIPESLTYHSVRSDKGVCVLNLHAGALEALPPDEPTQRLIFQSIVTTLLSLDSVGELQLLTDGEPMTTFGVLTVDSTQTAPAAPDTETMLCSEDMDIQDS